MMDIVPAVMWISLHVFYMWMSAVLTYSISIMIRIGARSMVLVTDSIRVRVKPPVKCRCADADVKRVKC